MSGWEQSCLHVGGGILAEESCQFDDSGQFQSNGNRPRHDRRR